MKTILKVRKKKLQINELLVIVCLSVLEISFMALDSSIISSIAGKLRILAGLILIIALLYEIRSFSITVGRVLYYVITILFSCRSTYFNLSVIIVITIIFWKWDNRKITGVLFAVQTICMVIFWGFYCTGTITNYRYVADGRIRNTFGFSNVNFAAFFFISWIVLWLIWRKMKTANVIVASIIVSVIFILSRSRTAILFYIMYIGFYYFFLYFLKRGKNVIIFTDFIMIMFFALPFLTVFLIRNFVWMDYILSGRLSVIMDSIKLLNLKSFLFGMDFVQKGTYISESFIVNMVFYFGFIFCIWTFMIILRGVNGLIKSRNTSLIAFSVSLWVANYAESYLFRLDNMTLIMFWSLIFIYAHKKYEQIEMETKYG